MKKRLFMKIHPYEVLEQACKVNYSLKRIERTEPLHTANINDGLGHKNQF